MRSLKSIKAERAKAELDDRDPRSRSDARTERLAHADRLMTLANTLCELPEKQLKTLELPDLVADAVNSGRLIESPNALKRQMKLIRKELGDADYEAIERQVEVVQNPGRQAPKAPKVDLTFVLYERLVEGGNDALFAFCGEHPELDITELRSLFRAADKQRKELRETPPAKLPNVRKLLDKLRRYATE
jgi:ribosome-associated protein